MIFCSFIQDFPVIHLYAYIIYGGNAIHHVVIPINIIPPRHQQTTNHTLAPQTHLLSVTDGISKPAEICFKASEKVVHFLQG